MIWLRVAVIAAALGGTGLAAKWWHDQAYAAGLAEGRAAQAEAMAKAMAKQAEVEQRRREEALSRQRERLQQQAQRDLENQRARIEAEKAMEGREAFPDECNLHPDDVMLFNTAIGANSDQSADPSADAATGGPGRPLPPTSPSGASGQPTGAVPQGN